jgi:hypothetical protein
MTPGSGIRIGDAEREAAATSLREHYARGRLTLEEFQQRLDAVFAAKTDTELASVTRDLPHTSPYAAPWPPTGPTGVPVPGPGYPQDPTQGYQYRGGRARPYSSFSWFGMAIFFLFVVLIATVAWPFGALPRIFVILLAILAFLRRIFRRRIRGGRLW